MTDIERLIVHVIGRPAPQGSKRLGEHGQMREQSVYLPSWRAAVRRDTYRAYRDAGILAEALPLFRGPVRVSIMFYLPEGRRIDGPPDLDKLTRSTWDALSLARVWEDDGRVVDAALGKRTAPEISLIGARIEVWRVIP